MANDKLFLVPKIIAGGTYFDISRSDIEWDLDNENGEAEYECDQYVTDDSNVEHVIQLRLNISCRSPFPVGWTISLKLHGVRIDGIDWHNKYDDPGGNECHGWHRHSYNARQQTADHVRVPITSLDDVNERTTFLIRAMSELRISLNSEDAHGTDELPFG